MNREEWLKALENNLCLPNEYSKEIIAEFESHLFQTQYDSSFNLKNLGNINLLIDQIMKSKKISTFKLLTLRSTWSLVALIITLVAIPYMVVTFLYNTIFNWLVYIVSIYSPTSITEAFWLGGFWLCNVLLVIALSYALTRILQKWKYEKQRILALSLSFFIILIVAINNLYLWDFSQKAMIYKGVSLITLAIVTLIYYLISNFFLSKFKRILGTGLAYSLIIIFAFLIFLPVMLLNEGIVSTGAKIWYSKTINSAEIMIKDISIRIGDGSFDLNSYNSPELENFGKLSFMKLSKCWNINEDPNAQGCDYEKESRVIDSHNCSEDLDLSTCKELIVWEESMKLMSYRLLINDTFECYTDSSEYYPSFDCYYKVY